MGRCKINFIQGVFEVETMIGILTRPPTAEEDNIVEFREYYEGDQNVKLTTRQKEYLRCDSDMPNAFVSVSKMVPNILLDRLSIKSNGQGIVPISAESQGFSDLVSGWWVARGLDKIQSDLHKLILRDGSAALFVEFIDEKPLFTDKPIYANRFEEGVRFHSEANAQDTHFDFATYQWPVKQYSINGDEIEDLLLRLNLYTPPPSVGGGSLIYRFKSFDGDSWIPLTDEEILNELGIQVDNPQELSIAEIPIVKFVNTDELSELSDIFRLQQLVNKSVGDIDISADQHAFPIFTAEEFPNVANQEIAPNMVMVGEAIRRVEHSILESMWMGTVLQYVDMISLVKRWPMWLLNPREFTVPSGTALRVAERPLVSQIREKQDSLSPQWRLAFDIGRQWHNAELSETVEGKISIKWQSAATENIIEDNSLIVQTAKQAGLPDATIWEQTLGLSTEQIADILTALQTDPDHIQQQSTIIQILSGALVGISEAAEFAGVPEDEALALATFGNAEPRDGDVTAGE